MKKKIISALIVLICTIGCKKSMPTTDKIIYNLIVSPKSVDADGGSIINVVCELNSDAATDKREIVLRLPDGGQFTENKDKKLIKKAEFEGGKLVVKADVLVPMNPGNLRVTAEPNLPDIKEDYIAEDFVSLLKSEADHIAVTGNSFYAWNGDFHYEVSVIGTLSNNNGNRVSIGSKVKIEDYFYNSGQPAGGRFRDVFLTSNSDSKVSVIYTPGNVPVGSEIVIRMTLIDHDGTPSKDNDSFLITTK